MSAIWWDAKVAEMPSLELSRKNGGGYMKPSWGQVAFVADAFDGGPPRKATINLDWGMTYAGSVHIFDGTILLRQQTQKKIVYDIFEPEFAVDLLETGTDVKGKDAVKPLVIGQVNYMTPLRTGADTEQKYYLPDFAGSIGNGINAYDDGVLINDNWTDNGDGTVSRSVNLVGELSLSGVGKMQTLGDVFSWGASQLGLTLVSDLADTDMPIDAVLINQTHLIDFLDQMAWYCDHGFYIRSGKLFLINNAKDNGSQEVNLSEDKYEPIFISPCWAQPCKKYSATWQTREAVEGEGRIEQKDHSVEVSSDFTVVGTEKTVSRVFNTDEAIVRQRLQALLDRANMPRIKLDIPLIRLPVYGECINFADEISYSSPIKGYMRCRKASLNYKAKVLHIEGDGEVIYG